jgi:hypothetical protein
MLTFGAKIEVEMVNPANNPKRMKLLLFMSASCNAFAI